MKRDWTTRSAIFVIGVIIIVVNLIGINLFARIDLTDDNVYSLSNASTQVVENLDDPVTVTAFFTDDLPAPYNGNRRFLKDKLDDYRAYGGRNFQYKFVDPASDEELQSEANRYRIPPVQIQVIESDNVQLKNAYMGVAIQYGGERETIPVVQDLSTLEYDITSAIRRLTRDELPMVGFLIGHGEPTPMQDLPTLYQELSRNYDVQVVNVENGTLEPRTDALFVIAPTDTIPDNHLRALDEFLMTGGRLGVLLNRVAAELKMGQAAEQFTGLETLLERYGATVLPNLVMDEQCSAVTIRQQQGFFNIAQQVRYQFFPVATNFNPNNLMVNRLSDVIFYFVSSIDTSGVVPNGVEVEPLVYSSDQAATQQGFFMIQPMMAQQTASFSGGPFLFAAAYRGVFPSAYAQSRLSESSRLVVVGDGDFINETIVGARQGNVEFGLNMVDWLIQDEALLAIRAKKIEPRSFDQISEGARPWVKYGNMIGPVLLVVLFGIYRWRRRKNRQILVVN